MSITAEQEREFYDRQYSRLLGRPDHELAVDRNIMRRTLNDPQQPVYERRRLYLAVLDTLLALPLKGAAALDYGCGPSDWGVLMATEGAHVTLLDLSPAAIELGLKRARASGVTVRGVARDASDLACFETAEFDIVYASAALHHTLKYRNAFEELVRVIKPGGVLILAETFGNNPVLNAARRLRAAIQGEAEEQGEEIILGDAELDQLRRAFPYMSLREMNLLAMGKRLFRGRFHSPAVRGMVAALESCDAALLGVFPWLKRYCGEVLVLARKA